MELEDLISKVYNLERDLEAGAVIENEQGHWTGDMYNMGGGASEYVVDKPAVIKPDLETREKAKKELQELYPGLQKFHKELTRDYIYCSWFEFSRKKKIKKDLEAINYHLRWIPYKISHS